MKQKKLMKNLEKINTMNYEFRAKQWYGRASVENDEFVKFILLYISLEVSVKLKSQNIRDIKSDNLVRSKFYEKVDVGNLEVLKSQLESRPLQNMDPSGDIRWSGRINSVEDFDGIIEFVIRARNNLFHGDKGLDEERDLFIVEYGNKILQPLLEVLVNANRDEI